MSEYSKKYYHRNKKKIQKQLNAWRQKNIEKTREYNRICRERHIDKYRAIARERYRIWISIEENRKHKKEYQKLWWKTKYEAQREDREELKEIYRVLEKGSAIINGYEVELKQDKGGMWFYYIKQNKSLVYISDKFATKADAIKDLQYAI